MTDDNRFSLTQCDNCGDLIHLDESINASVIGADGFKQPRTFCASCYEKLDCLKNLRYGL